MLSTANLHPYTKVFSLMTTAATLATSTVGSYMLGFRWSVSTPPGANLLFMLGHLQMCHFVSQLSIEKMPFGVSVFGQGLKVWSRRKLDPGLKPPSFKV